uniref:Uncharacterized protein n=1 Tax=Vitis vinifera TaxID=29760 RepID=A5BWK1_VITVI|nr:hypothetical protein VITISV_020019 [Vitis vinifera]
MKRMKKRIISEYSYSFQVQLLPSPELSQILFLFNLSQLEKFGRELLASDFLFATSRVV